MPAKSPVKVSAADGREAQKSDKTDCSAKAIIKLVEETGIRLFHTPAREPYVSFYARDHWENCGAKSPALKDWVSALCYNRKNFVPTQKALVDVTNTLAGHAVYGSPEKSVYVRVAGHEGAIYVDLGNPSWEAVKITPAGWIVVPHAPINFVRGASMLALPRPVRGSSVNQLRPLLNLDDEDHWILSVSFLLAAMHPTGPFPLLFLEGNHGSAKSAMARMLRGLVDPNSAPLRAQPSSARDLAISAGNAWCLGFDNVSSVPSWLSDSLCRLSTGGGFSTRALYTDGEEKIFSGTRPVILNGIDMCIRREDLMDRGIFIALPPIKNSRRLTEAEVNSRFEQARPGILGHLFDALACALRRLPMMKLLDPPRMADFATLVCAAAPALGWPEDAFLNAYARNRAASNAFALEASPLYHPISRIADTGPWEGTATELLGAVTNEQLNDVPENPRALPRTPEEFSHALRRLVPNFLQVGISVEFGRTAGRDSKRMIRVTKLIQND
jgi:hypothetical protein